MKRTLALLVLALALGAPSAPAAPIIGPILDGLCVLGCLSRFGDCTISDPRDPSVIPLKDPYCEEERAQCISDCLGNGGGGNGGITATHPQGLPLLAQPNVTACGLFRDLEAAAFRRRES